MLNTVKNVMHSFGDGTGDLAKRVGFSTADVAKRVGGGSVDLARWVGGSSAHLARRVGGGSVDLARRVGPRRGLIGLAVLAAAVGGTIYLMRYLRARQEAASEETETGTDEVEATPTNQKRSRRGKRRNDAHVTH